MKRIIISIGFLLCSGAVIQGGEQPSPQERYLQVLGQVCFLDAGTGVFVIEGLALKDVPANVARRNRMVYKELSGAFDPLHDYLAKGVEEIDEGGLDNAIKKVIRRVTRKLRIPNSLVRYLPGTTRAQQQREIIEVIINYLNALKGRVMELKAPMEQPLEQEPAKSEEPGEVATALRQAQGDREDKAVAAGEALPPEGAPVEPPIPEAPPAPDFAKATTGTASDVKIEQVVEEKPAAEMEAPTEEIAAEAVAEEMPQ